MRNEYYRFIVDRVKGLVLLPTHHPFYVLIEASGDVDVSRPISRSCSRRLWNMILDAALSNSNASAAAIWRIRDSVSALARTFPFAAHISFDVSLAIDRMDEYEKAIGARIKTIAAGAFTIVFGHVGDGNLHIDLHHEHTPDRRDDFESLVYQITSEFGGSISAEHGIGILKRAHLKMSRTPKEIDAYAQARARSAQDPEPGTNFHDVSGMSGQSGHLSRPGRTPSVP